LNSNEIPAAKISSDSKNTISLIEGAKTIKLDIVNTFGHTFKGGKNIKVNLQDLSDPKASEKDITS
jgi:hypothetical protein